MVTCLVENDLNEVKYNAFIVVKKFKKVYQSRFPRDDVAVEHNTTTINF